MALADNLATEKQKLTSLLENEYPAQSFRDNPLLRLLIVRFLLGELVGSSGGTSDASAANQTSVQSNVGAIPSKVLGVQGVVGGVAVPVIASAGTNLNTSALALESGGNLTAINNKLPSTLGAKTVANSLSIAIASDSALLPATIFTASTVCLTTALVEGSIALTSAKILAMESRTSTAFRLSTTSGNTINTQNFETALTGREYYQDEINFTGSFFFSAEALPAPITVLACATTNASPTITSANSFSGAVIGQAVTGTGIPANTFVIRRAADGLSITLGDANGATVNATATGSVTLTFSGAVIRISRWT